MSLVDKIKKALAGLAVVGTLALPQGIDYLVNGPYKVTQIGERLQKRVIHEYDNKIVVTGWTHPFGDMVVDYGKDGILDQYWLRSVPSGASFSIKIDPSSRLFQARQAKYVKLREK